MKKDNKKNPIAVKEHNAERNIDIIAGTILSRAHKLADGIINDAKTIAEESSAQKKANIDAYCTKIINDAKLEAKKIIDHTQMLSELESKKIAQNSLAHILDRTFLNVEKNILRLSQSDYLLLIEGMIKKYAEQNEELIISQEEKFIDKVWLDKINTKYKLNLKLSKEKGDFFGGVVLRNKIYDKNLTINALIKEMRQEIQSEVLEMVMENRRSI